MGVVGKLVLLGRQAGQAETQLAGHQQGRSPKQDTVFAEPPDLDRGVIGQQSEGALPYRLLRTASSQGWPNLLWCLLIQHDPLDVQRPNQPRDGHSELAAGLLDHGPDHGITGPQGSDDFRQPIDSVIGEAGQDRPRACDGFFETKPLAPLTRRRRPA